MGFCFSDWYMLNSVQMVKLEINNKEATNDVVASFKQLSASNLISYLQHNIISRCTKAVEASILLSN